VIPTFVYLNLEGHPRGNSMLQCLAGEGLFPMIVIEERSSLAEEGREGFAPVPQPPSAVEIIEGSGTGHAVVDDHNGFECERILREAGPDLVLLGDTRILRKNILPIPRLGIINVHPGYLPEVRGNNPYIWAIVEDLPLGCSAHFIDKGVDTGPLLIRQRIRPDGNMSYGLLLEEITRLCGEMIVEALHLVAAGMENGLPQERFESLRGTPRTFRAAPPEVKKTAIRKLEKGTYRVR